MIREQATDALSKAAGMSDRLTLKELSRYELGTFADVICTNAIFYPDHEAFVRGSKRISYKGFNESLNRLIHGLRELNIQRGAVIGIPDAYWIERVQAVVEL